MLNRIHNAASSNDNDNNAVGDADFNLCKPRNQAFNLATSNFVLEQTWTIHSVFDRPHCHSGNDRDSNLDPPRNAK